MTHAQPDTDLFDLPVEDKPDLSSFLPLSVAHSLTGQIHIVDREGATFVDRAFQLRSFPLRGTFKDEWEGLAPQIVDRINRFEGLRGATGEALEALKEISGVKLPSSARKAVARALMALAQAVKG